MDYMIIDQSSMDAYRQILFDYIGVAFDFAWPIFLTVGGLSILVFVLVKMYHWLH